MEECFLNALKAFEDFNKQKVQHIIIYRDGVGDGMRAQINREELRMLLATLKAYQPLDEAKVTLVVVNKRINQRFFEQTEALQIANPPAGTIIDTEMVQEQD